MTKADLTDAIYEKIGLSKRESAQMVDMVFESMKESLAAGENLKISGFGSFVVREKEPRIGRNPQTGDTITIEKRRVVTFRPSSVLKDAMNDE